VSTFNPCCSVVARPDAGELAQIVVQILHRKQADPKIALWSAALSIPGV
jgi:hypothetical protein